MKKLIKRIIEKSGFVLIALFFVSFSILSILLLFGSVAEVVVKIITIAGGDSLIRGILMAPFFVLGVIQIIRGAFAVLDADSKKFDTANGNYYLYVLYFVATLAGYVAVIMALIFWVKST